VMTFRLLPEMIDMTKTIYSVSKVRKPKNIKSFYKPYILLKALIYSSVKKAFVTSLALETKGVPSFTLECEPSKKPYYRLADLLFLALLASLIVLNFFPYF
jgi:energy-coupling factor transporter transmembrane protein EcfT